MEPHAAELQQYLRGVALRPALKAIWIRCRGFEVGRVRTVSDLRQMQRRLALPWELDVLLREVLRFAARDGGAIIDLQHAVALLRGVITRISADNVHGRDDAIAALFPLAHQQGPWLDIPWDRLCRYLRIFRHEALRGVVEKHLGLKVGDWTMLGLALAELLQKKADFNASSLLELPWMPGSSVKRFLELNTRSIEKTIEAAAKTDIDYGRGWAHAFNTLHERPILFDDAMPDRIYCPSPELLLFRVTNGLYYELIANNDSAFSNGLGLACEGYIGDVLKRTLKGKRCTHHQPKPFDGRNGLEHGTDWVIKDGHGIAFIECKAMRLGYKARSSVPGVHLVADLTRLAKAVVQNYENIERHCARSGRSGIGTQPSRKMYNLVLTLEDWGLSPDVQCMLDDQVRNLLGEKDVSEHLLSACPYKILSFRQFERTAQDIGDTTICAALDARYGKQARRRRYVSLFPLELAEAVPPQVAEAAGLYRLVLGGNKGLRADSRSQVRR